MTATQTTTTTTAVVRVRGQRADIVAADPLDPSEPLAHLLVERALARLALPEGVWRVTVEAGETPRLSRQALASADAHVVVARVLRAADEQARVTAVVQSPPGALAPDALARRVSEATAAVLGELAVGESRLVEIVADGDAAQG